MVRGRFYRFYRLFVDVFPLGFLPWTFFPSGHYYRGHFFLVDVITVDVFTVRGHALTHSSTARFCSNYINYPLPGSCMLS